MASSIQDLVSLLTSRRVLASKSDRCCSTRVLYTMAGRSLSISSEPSQGVAAISRLQESALLCRDQLCKITIQTIRFERKLKQN